MVHVEKVEFKDSGIQVIGIAPDPVAAVKIFATQYNVTVCGKHLPPNISSLD